MNIPQTYNNKPLVHAWNYCAMDGAPFGAVGRYQKGNDKKDVVPFFKPNGTGWTAGIDINPRPLYGLDKLADHPQDKAVFIAGCETKSTVSCSEQISQNLIGEIIKDDVEKSLLEKTNKEGTPLFSLEQVKSTLAKISLSIEHVRTVEESTVSTKKSCKGTFVMTIPSDIIVQAENGRNLLGLATLTEHAKSINIDFDANKFSKSIAYSVQPTDDGKEYFGELQSIDAMPLQAMLKEISESYLVTPIIQTNAEKLKQINEPNTDNNSQQEKAIISEKPSSELQKKIVSEDPKKESVKRTTWTGNWGNGIVALVNTEQCPFTDFLKEGYSFLMTSSIPVSRLKKPSDAYFVSGDRAATVMGCWHKKEGAIIHVKLKRKHDGKVWEVDNKLDDIAIWTSNVTADENNNQSSLDEANKNINIVWNGATKEIRAMLLQEQKDWLKKRESDCSLKASLASPKDNFEKDSIRLNCMVEITDLRTEVLKQKIAASSKEQPNADDGHKWLESAPAFCNSKPYSNLTPKQMSICEEVAFRHMSKNWKTITASNGQAYEIALDTITTPLKPNSDPGATLRGALVLVYLYKGETFNPKNVLRFYFDCHDRFQTFSSDWSPVTYMPPFSVVAEISRLACNFHNLKG